MQFQTPFAMGKKWGRRQMVELSSENKVLKVYSGTGSCNFLNTSNYTSNHSNSWWNVCCNQPSLTGLWHKQRQHQEQSLSCTLSQNCISSWPWENSEVQAEGHNFLSSQNGIMMSTQARRMFCASTYQGMLAPSSQCTNWLIEITFKGTVATKCGITQSSIALSLERRCHGFDFAV